MEASIEFLKREFFKYYYENLDKLVPPGPIKNREFGFFIDKGKGMLRHRCFNSLGDFHQFVLNEVPLDIYVSAARYEDPSNRDMQEKRLINAELFFDIDAEPVTGVEESAWICSKCGRYDLGVEEKCPVCGSIVEHADIVDENQLEKALKEADKLISVLIKDFGINEDCISVFFSGNRGYHVHVDQEEFINLTSEGRREIVDYLLIQGFERKKFIDLFKKKGPYDNYLKGMMGRVYHMVLETCGDKLGASYDKRRILKHVDQAIEELKVRIDPVVTIDTHRLMRMPGSINSNSGMAKKKIRLQDLRSFNPLSEAVVLGDEETVVRVKAIPRFKLGEKSFGPFKDEEVELPAYAAVYIVCKGLGEYVR
ncbi:MAG: DNA primase small subunit domain-containing protein [Thermoproteota archaeon]